MIPVEICCCQCTTVPEWVSNLGGKGDHLCRNDCSISPVSVFTINGIFIYNKFKSRKQKVFAFLIICVLGLVIIYGVGLLDKDQDSLVHKTIRYSLIGLLRPVVVLPFVIIGTYIYGCFIEMSRKKLICLSLLSLLTVACGIIKIRVTLVALQSIPIWAAYTFGSIISMGFISICKLIENSIVSQPLQWFGKYSLFIMVTHEFFGIREGVQLTFSNIIRQRWIVYLLTFIFVLLIEFIAIRFLYIPAKKRLENMNLRN